MPATIADMVTNVGTKEVFDLGNFSLVDDNGNVVQSMSERELLFHILCSLKQLINLLSQEVIAEEQG